VSRRFDALLFDAGGVLVLPDPTVIGPLLAYYGGDASIDAHRRAHYAAMAAKSTAGAVEADWFTYDMAYVRSVGVADSDMTEAAELLGKSRHAPLWRWVIPESRAALDRLAAAGIPMGVVSNASGQIAAVLARETCQVGEGPHVAMRVIVDSELVGVSKPDPAIFEHALPHFAEFDRARIAYVGDSVTMDIASARGAGLHPILVDPHDDHPDADFERIVSLAQLADELTA
jgi:putative hydrolase of the HAD superfamily